MKRHFKKRDDPETAEKFHLSSMEYAQEVGGDPLCLVTEFPLYVLHAQRPDSPAGAPLAYLELKDRLPELQKAAEKEAGGREKIQSVLNEYEVEPLSLRKAVGLQLETIRLGVERILREGA